jgi:hypothetical protein
MATSGSVDFSMQRDDVITFALKKIGILPTGGTATTNQKADAATELNMIVKHMEVAGLQLWAKKQGFLFLQADTAVYQLGGSAYDKATNSYAKTTLSADAAASATSLSVASITGISNADQIGIVLDDGTLHWDVVNGAPSGTTVTLTTGLASAASSGAYVFAYTNNITKPLRVYSAHRRDTSGIDTELVMSSLDEYNDLSNKTSDGTVTQLAVRPDNAYTEMYVWPEPDDVSDVIMFWYQRPFEDFDASTDTPDLPQEWYLTLGYMLAMHLAITYGVPDRIRSEVRNMAMLLEIDIESWDQEDASIYLQPDLGPR